MTSERVSILQARHLGDPIYQIHRNPERTRMSISFVRAISTLPKTSTPRFFRLLCSRGAHEATANSRAHNFEVFWVKVPYNFETGRTLNPIAKRSLCSLTGELGNESSSCASAAGRKRRPMRRGRESWTKSSRLMRSVWQRRSSCCCWVRLRPALTPYPYCTNLGLNNAN